MTHINQHIGLGFSSPRTRARNESTITLSHGAYMLKPINIPLVQIKETTSEMLLLLVGQSGHRLSLACKANIAAVIKARNDSKNRA